MLGWIPRNQRDLIWNDRLRANGRMQRHRLNMIRMVVTQIYYSKREKNETRFHEQRPIHYLARICKNCSTFVDPSYFQNHGSLGHREHN